MEGKSAGTVFCSQLKAMLVRNCLLKARQRKSTAIEAFLPVYTLGLLIVVRLAIPNPNFPREDTPGEEKLIFEHFKNLKNHTIAVVPNTTETKVFLESVNQLWSEVKTFTDEVDPNNPPIEFMFFETKEDLMERYWKDPHSIPLALIFESDLREKSLRYEIRTNPSYETTPTTSELHSSRVACRRTSIPIGKFIPKTVVSSVDCPVEQYLRSGFLALQMLIDFTKIRVESNRSDIILPQMSVQMFPKEAFTGDWVIAFRVLIPFYTVMSLSQFVTYLLILIVGEKEKKIKEGMKMMGVKDSVYWTSWFIVYGVFVSILSVIATILLYTLQVFQHSNYLLIYLLVQLYSMTIVLFSFMLTPLFNKARTAGFLGSFAVNVMSLFYFVRVIVSDSSSYVLWLVSTISSSGFALAMDKAIMLDLQGEGVNFGNLWDGPGMPFAGSLIMMAIDNFLYAFIAYYLDNVIPSEYGTKRSPFFILDPNFCCPKAIDLKGHVEVEEGNLEAEIMANETNSNDIEPVRQEMKDRGAIKIINLHKTFNSCRKEQVAAINGINLTIYEGQITAILGHNGAGKTTLFNILTGLTAPTEGTAYIFGLDIRDPENLAKLRRVTGVCPQHDILFDLLTPKEHLHFFAGIRGVPLSNIDAEVDRTLNDIDLTNEADCAAKCLSGGQKRKLSVGIAVIGDPQIVILDEPTAGVDPYSRRHMWSVLQNRKQGKVILLTTHFMDEADILADRKAVISKGKLRCCGSSLFLKNKFGIGYHLTMVLGRNAEEEAIIEMVLRHLPTAEKARHLGKEISFILPHDAVDRFALLFQDIEKEINDKDSDLHISSYGVSMTTLEEVYLHLEKDEETELNEDNTLTKNLVRNRAVSRSLSMQSRTASHSNLQTVDLNVPIETPHGSNKKKRSFEEGSIGKVNGLCFEASAIAPNTRQIFFALVKLRITRLVRDIYRFLFLVFTPIAFSALGFLSLSNQNLDPKMKPLILNSNTYGGSRSTIAVHSYSNDITELVGDLDTNTEWFDGNFSTLLEISPHIAAFDVISCCDLSQLRYTALYNDTATHSLPVLVNIINNALYRYIVGYGLNETIMVKTHPFQMTSQPDALNFTATASAIMLGMMFLLVPVTLAIDIIQDREIKAKNQLRVNGLSFNLYYLTYFFVFVGLMFITFSGILATIFLFDLPSLNQLPSFLTLCSFIALYCPATILFSTCISFAFEKADTAQTFLPNSFFVSGILQFLFVVILDTFEIGGKVYLQVHVLFSFMSTTYGPFAMIYFINRVHSVCHVNMACTYLTVWNYLTYEIIFLFTGQLFQIPFWYCILKKLDARYSGRKGEKEKPKKSKEEGPTDEFACDLSSEGFNGSGDRDVRLERERVETCMTTTVTNPPVILLQEIRKEYEKKNIAICCKSGEEEEKTRVAVDNLSLAVEPGEVFGLLGHNGAGKTTTMKIITAEETPTLGKVQVGGEIVSSNNEKVFQLMGYCPQDDTHWKNITLREHLELYANIRGVPPDEITVLINSYLQSLHIMEHADKESQYCSGGTKRKLSFALSMIGNPCIVLLDEPSTGMDPKSKRFLWDTILASFQDNRGAILTTHSMEEADALCSRVGIMVNGELRCIGSTQHIKNLYGAGYSLEIKLSPGDQTTDFPTERQSNLKEFVFTLFPDAVLEESFEERLVFSVPQHAVKSLAECFSKLEEAKRDLNIEEYSFSQTTLEQVFIKFAQHIDAKNK